MTALDLVKSFYQSDVANDADIVKKFFHKDAELHWTSSQGFRILTYKDLESFFADTRKSFELLRFEFTHLIESGNTVVTRHSLIGNTIEAPNTDIVLGHFSTIWEVKDGKLYRGFEISQPADENDKYSMDSYAKRKI